MIKIQTQEWKAPVQSTKIPNQSSKKIPNQVPPGPTRFYQVLKPQPLLQCLLSSTVRCSISFLIRVLAAVAAIILRTAPEIAVTPGTARHCPALRTCSKPKISLEISFHLASELTCLVLCRDV